MKGKIKLIIFDLYGVIVLGSYVNTCRYLSRRFRMPYELLWQVLYEKFFNMAALGKVTDRESFVFAIQELKLPLSWQWLYRKHLSFLNLSKQSFEYARLLQKRGYTVLLLSKNTQKQFHDIIKKTKVNRYFPNIINTYDLGLPKASRETMQYVFKKFKVRASEVIMVDDQKNNLVFPEKMGAHAIFYKSFKQMRKEITTFL